MFLQLYPDTVQYELTIEGKNHTIHLEKNRYKLLFFLSLFSSDQLEIIRQIELNLISDRVIVVFFLAV